MKHESTDAAIIVIGASSGLGRGIAEVYASRGFRVGVCARREEPLRQMAEKYPNVAYRKMDVTADDYNERLAEFLKEIPLVGTVVYAAGCGWNNPDLDTKKDNRTVRTNVEAFTNTVNTVYKHFLQNPLPDKARGHICVITSIAGTKGIGISATYSATKRYQTTYLEAIRQLVHTKKVALDITDIRPGFIDTALLDTKTHRYPLLMPVNYAVKRIVRAIEANRKIAYIDWKWHLVVCLWRLIPGCLWSRIRLNN